MESLPFWGVKARHSSFFWTDLWRWGARPVHCSTLPRAHARSFEIRLHRAGPDPLADELDHVEKPASGRRRYRSLLGLLTGAAQVSPSTMIRRRATPATGSGMEPPEWATALPG